MIVVDRLPEAAPSADSQRDALVLAWDEREKTRQRVRTAAGRELAIKLPTGTRLRPGTVVVIAHGFHVEVAAADEDVWSIRSDDPRVLARASYEIGNRHLAVEIGSGEVAVRYDHTLEDLWRRIGLPAVRAHRPFLAEQRPSHAHAWERPVAVRSA